LPEVREELIKQITKTTEVKVEHVQPLCLLIGSLHLSSLLDPNLLKVVIENFTNSIDHLTLA
jgi:hypothetical protein